MQIYKIIVTPSAKGDIKEITDYLSSFSYYTAQKYSEYINETVQSLKTMPTRCAFVRNKAMRNKGYRWISVRNYTIFFIVDEAASIVRVERVLYSRREYDVII